MSVQNGISRVARVLLASGVMSLAHAAVGQEEEVAAGLQAIQPVAAETQPPRDQQPVDLHGDPLPRGAIARLGTIRYRHSGWYKRVAFLHDNETFVVWGTSGGTARLWNAESGRLVGEISTGDANLQALCLSRDGTLLAVLASTYDRQAREYQMLLKVWEMPRWKELAAFGWIEPLTEASKEIALAPDGALIATGTRNGKLRLWDLASGKELLSYRLVEGEIDSVDFSPSGDALAVASRRGVVLWEWLTEKEPQQLHGLSRDGQVVKFSPGGSLLAVGEDGDCAARLFEVSSGKLVRTMTGNAPSYYREGLAFSADGESLIVPANSHHAVEIFSVETGELDRTLNAGRLEPRGAAISSDGRLLAAVGSETEVKVWDLDSDELLSDRFLGHAETPYEVVYLADGKQIATGSIDGTVRIWDALTGAHLRVLKHERWVAALAVSPDGKRLLSSGHDDTVRLWNAETGEEIYKLAGHGRTGGNRESVVAFTPDGNSLLCFGTDMYLRTFDVQTGKAAAEHAIRPSGLELEVTAEGKIQLKDSHSRPFGGLSMDLGSAKFSGDGTHLLLATREKTLHVFDVESGEEVGTFEPPKPFDEYALSPDSRLLAMIGKTNAQQPNADPASHRSLLQLRKYTGKEVIWQREVPGSFSGELRFSPEAQLVAASLYGESQATKSKRWISVYSAETGEETYRIEDFPQNSNHFRFSPDGRHLAASYTDSSVLVWDLEQFRVD